MLILPAAFPLFHYGLVSLLYSSAVRNRGSAGPGGYSPPAAKPCFASAVSGATFINGNSWSGPHTSPKRRCVFCDDPGKITPEHMIPSWMLSGESASGHLYVRESAGPNYEPRHHALRVPNAISPLRGRALNATPAG
jgi:hypothetical protein